MNGLKKFSLKIKQIDKIEESFLYAYYLHNKFSFFSFAWKMDKQSLNIYIINTINKLSKIDLTFSYDLLIKEINSYKKFFISKNDFDWIIQNKNCGLWLLNILRFDFNRANKHLFDFTCSNFNPINSCLPFHWNTKLDIGNNLDNLIEGFYKDSLFFTKETTLDFKKINRCILSYLNIISVLIKIKKSNETNPLDALKIRWYKLYSKNNGVVIDWDMNDEQLSHWVWSDLNRKFNNIPEKLFNPISSKEYYLATQGFLLFISDISTFELTFPYDRSVTYEKNRLIINEQISTTIDKIKIGINQYIRREKDRIEKNKSTLKIAINQSYQQKLTALAKANNKRGTKSTIEFLIDEAFDSLKLDE